MPTLQKLLLEAIVVGLLLIPATYVAGFFARMISSKPSLPEVCSGWNKYYIMEVNLLFAGIIFHIVAEISGLNRWYVKQYRS